MIEKLATHNVTQSTFVDKLNEVIDAFNEFATPKPIDPLTPVQREWVQRYEMADFAEKAGVLVGGEKVTAQTMLQEILDKWNVEFYDNMPHTFEAPVACKSCGFNSQSLLDRMLLNPKTLCAGCIEKAKFG